VDSLVVEKCVAKLTGLSQTKIDIITSSSDNVKRDELQSASAFTVTSSPSSGLSTGVIVGIVVGSVCGVIILVVLVSLIVFKATAKEERI